MSRIRNRDLSLIASSGHSVDFRADTGVVLTTQVFEPHRARILFRNTTGATAKLYYAAILGDALVRTKIERTIVPDSAVDRMEYTSKNIYTSAVALTHARDRARQVLFAEYEYSFGLNESVATGTVIQLIQDEPAIDTTALIVEMQVDFDRPRPLYRYRAIGLTSFDAMVGLEIGTDQVQPQRQLAARPTRSDIIEGTQGITAVTVDVPTIAAAATQRSVTLVISRQSNMLASSLVYDLQIQYDGSGWYSLGPGGSSSTDWQGVADEWTTTSANIYKHESLPFGGTDGVPTARTYDYRVRARTAATTSDWSSAASVNVAPLATVDFASGAITALKMSTDDFFTIKLTATEGTVGGWELSASVLTSRIGGAGKGVTLDHTENRISVFDATNEKVVMGYLDGLPKRDGTGNWGPGDYGFWARQGDQLRIDGDVEYVDGDWLIGSDASLLIESAGTAVVRLGTISGDKGLFINETATGASYRAQVTGSDFFVGNDSTYLSFASGVLSLALTTFQVSSLNTDVLGTLRVSDAGTITSLTNPLSLTRGSISSPVALGVGVTTANKLEFKTNGTVRMTIAGGGALVGIGASPITHALTVNGDVKATNFRGNVVGGTSLSLASTDANDLTLTTNSVERMRILSDGTVGIGTSTPVEKLSVNGNIVAGSVDVGGTRWDKFHLHFNSGWGSGECATIGSAPNGDGQSQGIMLGAAHIPWRTAAAGAVIRYANAASPTQSWDLGMRSATSFSLFNTTTSATLFSIDSSAFAYVGALEFFGKGGNSGNGAHIYAIFQEGGAWVPPYPALRIAYHTGIKIGARTEYGGTQIHRTELMDHPIARFDDNGSHFYKGLSNEFPHHGGPISIYANTDNYSALRFIRHDGGLGGTIHFFSAYSGIADNALTMDFPEVRIGGAWNTPFVTVNATGLEITGELLVSATGTFAGILSTYSDCKILGALSKGSGSFRIDHPLKPDTHHLVHSFIEGPDADLIYSGMVSLVDGVATVDIDEVARMTPGTFDALCRRVRRFCSNESGFTAIRTSLSGSQLHIEAEDTSCTDEAFWMVIGERKDKHMMSTSWTDDDGRVIVEPEKEKADASSTGDSADEEAGDGQDEGLAQGSQGAESEAAAQES